MRSELELTSVLGPARMAVGDEIQPDAVLQIRTGCTRGLHGRPRPTRGAETIQMLPVSPPDTEA
jgi:hypothetical protein